MNGMQQHEQHEHHEQRSGGDAAAAAASAAVTAPVPTTMEFLAAQLRLQQRRGRALSWAFWGAAAVVILGVWILTAMMRYGFLNASLSGPLWSWEVLRRALETGTFWSHPMEAIFQAPYITLAEQPWQIFILMLIWISAAFWAVFLLLRLMVWVVRALVRHPQAGSAQLEQIEPPAPSRLLSLLIPGARRRSAWRLRVSGRDVLVQLVGDRLIATLPLKRTLPELYLDSKREGVNTRLGRRLRARRRDEVVLDAVCYESFALYSPSAVHPLMPRLFGPEVLAQLVKPLDGVELLVQGRILHAVIEVTDARLTGSASEPVLARELETVLAETVVLTKLLEQRAERVAAASAAASALSEAQLPVRLGRNLTLSVPQPSASGRRFSIPLIVPVLALIATLVIATWSGEGTLSDLIGYTAISAGLLVLFESPALRQWLSPNPRLRLSEAEERSRRSGLPDAALGDLGSAG